jgi:hypothetical protein
MNGSPMQWGKDEEEGEGCRSWVGRDDDNLASGLEIHDQMGDGARLRYVKGIEHDPD